MDERRVSIGWYDLARALAIPSTSAIYHFPTMPGGKLIASGYSPPYTHNNYNYNYNNII